MLPSENTHSWTNDEERKKAPMTIINARSAAILPTDAPFSDGLMERDTKEPTTDEADTV